MKYRCLKYGTPKMKATNLKKVCKVLFNHFENCSFFEAKMLIWESADDKLKKVRLTVKRMNFTR